MVLLIKTLLSKLKDLKSTTKFILLSLIYVSFAFIFFWAFRDETGNLAWAYTVANFIVGLLYFPVPFFVFVYFIVRHFSKKRGEGRPLSYEAMKTSKANIPDRIYKFCSLSTDKSEKLNQDKLNSLRTNKVWFSSCDYLNDPFEGQLFCFPDNMDDYPCPDELKEKYNIKTWEDLKNILINVRKQYMQCSFSKEYSDILMWGYYANGCRGYCIEYKVLEKNYLFPATYVKKRPINDGILIDKKQHRAFYRNRLDFQTALRKCSSKEFIDYVLYLQSIKSNEWIREKEVRLINYGLFDGKNGINESIETFGIQVSKIIIGYLCIYKDELIEIAKYLNVPYTIMEPSYQSDTYQLIEKSE